MAEPVFDAHDVAFWMESFRQARLERNEAREERDAALAALETAQDALREIQALAFRALGESA